MRYKTKYMLMYSQPHQKEDVDRFGTGREIEPQREDLSCCTVRTELVTSETLSGAATSMGLYVAFWKGT